MKHWIAPPRPAICTSAEVKEAAAETSAVSSQVLGAADDLGTQAAALRTGVDRFLGDIRAG